jgi:hypothetical protein
MRWARKLDRLGIAPRFENRLLRFDNSAAISEWY